MTSNITLSKGSTSVTIYSAEVDDNFKNTIIEIKVPQTVQNQSDGPNTNKMVDLQRVSHSILIRGEIIQTASKSPEATKDDLVSIWKGAGQSGGTVSLNYEGNSSAFGSTTDVNPISGYITDLLIKEKSMDEPDSLDTGVAKYTVQITFLEGTSVTG